jgi:hypothetical protein
MKLTQCIRLVQEISSYESTGSMIITCVGASALFDALGTDASMRVMSIDNKCINWRCRLASDDSVMQQV